MKHIIKDEDLVLYVTDNLSAGDKCLLEQQAVDNGETDLLFHCMVSNYNCNLEYADELLGEDTFVHRKLNKTSTSPLFTMPLAADRKNPE